mmetsp:Transcript_3109/g.9114  ORF Transcript_3109/g.9114 Transcript_3109/m.9114 type:complete len:89 (-) Transcript_3109:1269-1535(-)
MECQTDPRHAGEIMPASSSGCGEAAMLTTRFGSGEPPSTKVASVVCSLRAERCAPAIARRAEAGPADLGLEGVAQVMQRVVDRAELLF